MAFDIVKKYFEDRNLGNRIKTYGDSCATVDEAAKIIGENPARIAKSLTLRKDDSCKYN